MSNQSQSVSGYLGEHIAAPENLTTVFTHIDELVRKTRSSRCTPQVRLAALLAGASTRPVFACFVQDVYPAFVDVTRVNRTFDGIHTYLKRVVLPDEANEARALVLEHLNIDDFDQLCSDLVDLNESHPKIVTALLEMRIGTAQRLMAVAQSTAEDTAEAQIDSQLYSQLLTEMTKVRIAYRLRCVAMKSAAQIHAPFAWDPLDGLERAGIGGCLRVMTLINRLKFDLDLVKAAVDCYATPFGNTAQFQSLSLFSASNPRYNRTAQNDAKLTLASLEPRARLQLAIWQAQHGAALPSLLDQVMDEIKQWLATFETQLAAFKIAHKANSIVGDLNRARSGEQLYLAVREGIAWVRDLKSNEGAVGNGCAIDVALRTVPDASLPHWGYALPRLHHEAAAAIDNLFMVYRFVYLQDNEVLPLALRQVETTGPDASKIVTKVKTHDRAAAIRGSRYTFQEQWSAWQREITRKTAKAVRESEIIIKDAEDTASNMISKMQRKKYITEEEMVNARDEAETMIAKARAQAGRMIAQARQIDLLMKRRALFTIKGGHKVVPFSAFIRLDELRGSIIQGFVN